MDMRYSHAEKLIRTGDVYTCAGKWLMSKVIRWCTGEAVSHVGIFVWLRFNGKRTLAMFESMEGTGVRIIPARYTLENTYWKYGSKIFWQSIHDSRISGEDIANFFLEHWGEGYADPRQFIVIMSRLSKFVRRKLGLSLDTNKNRWHCSEITTRAFMTQGVKWEKEPAITNPGDITKFNCLGPMVELVPG